MKGILLFSTLVALILVFGTVSAASAASQLEVAINPNIEQSEFKIRYQKTVIIDYENGGQIADSLRGTSWFISADASPSSPDSAAIADAINQNILGDQSQVRVSDLDVKYYVGLRGNQTSALIDYNIEIIGNINNYIIRDADDQKPALIDMAWRALSIQDPVYINGVEINYLFSAIQAKEPVLASLIAGSEAEELLRSNLINADFIRKQPLSNWHFLFDPTGINEDASRFGLSDEISGFVVSTFTMGESGIREGIQIEQSVRVEFTADKPYAITTIQAQDIASVSIIGFAKYDMIDGIEIFGVTSKPPEGYADTSTGSFPVTIMYGMAGMAAVGGISFFVYSSRQMKKEQGQGQSGIDPSRLVGYSTSESSGGYKTNRGEAQLRDDASYQQTRNVYEQTGTAQAPPPPSYSPPPPPPPQSPPSTTTAQEAACGCAASADIGSECDCEMQCSCLCDADCLCSASVCKEHSQSF